MIEWAVVEGEGDRGPLILAIIALGFTLIAIHDWWKWRNGDR